MKSPPAYRQAGSPLFALRAGSPMDWKLKRGRKRREMPHSITRRAGI